MPYITMNERTKFNAIVKSMVDLVSNATDPQGTQGEYFGFYVHRIVRHFLNDPNYASQSFNSNVFKSDKKDSLVQNADRASALLNRADPITSAGDLNYAITAPLWGILGDSEKVTDASYGMRAYLTGILIKIRDSVESSSAGSQRDATLSFRRHLVIKGVLDDVINETYRRKTAFFQDEKRMENKDLWTAGELVLPKGAK